MDMIKSIFQKACWILCFLCIGILYSLAQTKLLITYLDQTTETELIVEDGQASYNNISISGNSNSITVLFSDPTLTTGSHTLYYGGTIPGGIAVNDYNSGGYSRSVTIGNKVTTVGN